MIHRLLQRQLKALSLDETSPPDLKAWRELLRRISCAYSESDQERYLLERSLVISSREMQERWEALEAQRAAAVESSRMATLGQMAGGIAHEINSPLAVVYMLAEEIQSEAAPFSPRLAQLGAKIEVTAHKISKIIKGLRSLSRDDSSEPTTELSPLRVIDEALDVCRQKFALAGIRLELDIEPGCRMLCRPVQISQVILNLLSNSFDAVSGTQNAWVKICAYTEGENVRISVTDSGPGIPPDVACRIMEPFFSTKPPGKGTGLGLSISKKLLEAQGGTLELDAASPNTKFVVSLCRAPVATTEDTRRVDR